MVHPFGLSMLLRVLLSSLKLLLDGILLNLPEGFDHDVAASSLSDHPDVWTDGSSVLDRLTGISASGAGFFCQPF